jgi:predicted permease
MGTLWRDIRYGFRMLVKSPGFTAIAILTLALGIGANTAIFSVVSGVLLNPLPFPSSGQLVSVYSKLQDFDQASISFPNFLDWQRDNSSFSSLAAYRNQDFTLARYGEPERLHGEQVSAEFFTALGVEPVAGRNFRPEEDRVGAAPVALISEGLWKRKFGSSFNVLGQALSLNGTAYTVVGIFSNHLPMFDPEFAPDIFAPIGQWNDPTFRDRKAGMGTNGIARLKTGISVAAARMDMNSVAHNLAVAYPDEDKGTGVAVIPLKTDIVGSVQTLLYLLFGAVGFVLLIACANVANLLLARSTGRTREFAVRTALGASPARVIRQLLTESILLAVAGGAVGIAFAKWGLKAALAAVPQALPRADNIRLDMRVLLFTVAVALFAGILFGLAPAVKTMRMNLADTLKEGGRGASGTRHRTQRIFVAAEMALSLVLLIGAGLMIRTLTVLWRVNPGFNPHNALTFTVAFSKDKLAAAAQTRTALNAITAKFESVPGVQAASALAGALPMQGDSELPFWLDGQPRPASQNEMNVALWYPVQPDDLKVMGIPLLRGRFLTVEDNENAPHVMVIDEAFARRFYPNQDPIGKRINFSLIIGHAEIVGVVGHIKHWGLGDTAHKNLQAEFYSPLNQLPDNIMPLVAGGILMVVRTSGPPAALTGALSAASAEYDANGAVYDFRTMDRIVADSIAGQRFTMILLAVFAALALLLSAVGIYGVISYLVGQRVHEIGVRMALGAQQRDILRMVLGDGMRTALIGVAIGIAAALGLTRLMTKMIFGVNPADPITYGVVGLLLLLVALAACYVPARRAMRIDPMVALRYE